MKFDFDFSLKAGFFTVRTSDSSRKQFGSVLVCFLKEKLVVDLFAGRREELLPDAGR